MTLERQESIAAGVGVFILVEALGAVLTTGALLADQYLVGTKPTWEAATVGATVTTVLAALFGINTYRVARTGEGYRYAERERARGVIDV